MFTYFNQEILLITIVCVFQYRNEDIDEFKTNSMDNVDKSETIKKEKHFKKIGSKYIQKRAPFKIAMLKETEEEYVEQMHNIAIAILEELIYRVRHDIDLIKNGSWPFQSYKFFEKYELKYLEKHLRNYFSKFCEIICNFHDALIDELTFLHSNELHFRVDDAIRKVGKGLYKTNLGLELKQQCSEIFNFFLEHLNGQINKFLEETLII